VGEGREGDMKGGRGSMRAGGLFGLTWPRNHKTMSCHALGITRGSQTRSYSPRKRAEKSESSEWLVGMGHSPGTSPAVYPPLKCIENLHIYRIKRS